MANGMEAVVLTHHHLPQWACIKSAPRSCMHVGELNNLSLGLHVSAQLHTPGIQSLGGWCSCSSTHSLGVVSGSWYSWRGRDVGALGDALVHASQRNRAGAAWGPGKAKCQQEPVGAEQRHEPGPPDQHHGGRLGQPVMCSPCAEKGMRRSLHAEAAAKSASGLCLDYSWARGALVGCLRSYLCCWLGCPALLQSHHWVCLAEACTCTAGAAM